MRIFFSLCPAVCGHISNVERLEYCFSFSFSFIFLRGCLASVYEDVCSRARMAGLILLQIFQVQLCSAIGNSRRFGHKRLVPARVTDTQSLTLSQLPKISPFPPINRPTFPSQSHPLNTDISFPTHTYKQI